MIDLSYKDIFGNIRKEQETANSYLINCPGNYCFPLVYGCGIMDGKNNLVSYANQGKKGQADFLDYQDKIIRGPEIGYKGEEIKIIAWDNSREAIKDIKIVGDYIQFSISSIPEDGGNYVLALFDQNEKIIWSWHIWLWKYKLKNIDIGKYKLLNINLASHREFSGELRNWFYQWGRKDPLCYLDKMIGIKADTANSVGYSIQNPRTFFVGNNSEYKFSWMKRKSFYNYWNYRPLDKIVEKTIYDPCPPGYSVPGHWVFSELIKDKYKWDNKNKSIIFEEENILFPASGCRSRHDGMINNINNGGYYWSSETIILNFCSNKVYQLTYGFSACGFSIRPCVI